MSIICFHPHGNPATLGLTSIPAVISRVPRAWERDSRDPICNRNTP